MTIQRLYEPDPEALDRVVETLYQLLVEPPGGRHEKHESGPGEPTNAVRVNKNETHDVKV
jgi:hypothetical protein